VDKPRKILWNTFFGLYFDFFVAFALIKRALIFFALVLYMLSYYESWKPYVEEFDKLFLPLTDAPCAPVFKRPYTLGAPRT